jgi:hypothetical protein
MKGEKSVPRDKKTRGSGPGAHQGERDPVCSGARMLALQYSKDMLCTYVHGKSRGI